MDPKICTACRAPHFEDWDLCGWCSNERQRELERRLRERDNATGFATVAAWALYGPSIQNKVLWKIT